MEKIVSYKKRLSQNSKNCQIELVEIDNFLNFEMYAMFRQAANDIFYKMMILKLLESQPEPVESGVLNDSPKFDKLTLTVLKFISSEKNFKNFFN